MIVEQLASWQRVLRYGLFPQWSDEHLRILLKACQEDDPRLLQGQTCSPPAMNYMIDWPPDGGCLIGYTNWKVDGLITIGQVMASFAETTDYIDTAMGEPAGCRWLLNWWDEGHRDQCLKALIEEIELELTKRSNDGGDHDPERQSGDVDR